MAENEPNYELPASQVDLQRRLENENKSDRIVSTSDLYENEVYEDKPGYVGTDPMYQNAATPGSAPGMSTEGPEAEVFANFLDKDPEEVTPAADGDDEDDTEEEDTSSSSSTSSTTSPSV